MKKKLPPRKAGKPQSWIITALLAAVAVAYVVFVFLPGQRTINERRAQVQERQQQIMQAHTLAQTVAQTRERLAATRRVGQQWHDDSPRRRDVIAHFASFTQEAQRAGVAIDRLDPLPAVDQSRVAQQNVSLQLHGSFAGIFDLLKRLEAIPGSLWVRTLRLQAGRESDAAQRSELTVTIFVDRND